MNSFHMTIVPRRPPASYVISHSPEGNNLIVPTITPLPVLNTVLLIVGAVGLLLGVMTHLLAIVKVLAVRLDQLVCFSGGEAGHDVFGHSVVFGDAC